MWSRTTADRPVSINEDLRDDKAQRIKLVTCADDGTWMWTEEELGRAQCIMGYCSRTRGHPEPGLTLPIRKVLSQLLNERLPHRIRRFLLSILPDRKRLYLLSCYQIFVSYPIFCDRPPMESSFEFLKELGCFFHFVLVQYGRNIGTLQQQALLIYVVWKHHVFVCDCRSPPHVKNAIAWSDAHFSHNRRSSEMYANIIICRWFSRHIRRPSCNTWVKWLKCREILDNQWTSLILKLHSTLRCWHLRIFNV